MKKLSGQFLSHEKVNKYICYDRWNLIKCGLMSASTGNGSFMERRRLFIGAANACGTAEA